MEPDDEEKPLREQMTEALEECRREIEILQRPSNLMGFFGLRQDNRREIAMLEIEFRRLTEALNNLPPDRA
jgi:hypothetical protein